MHKLPLAVVTEKVRRGIRLTIPRSHGKIIPALLNEMPILDII